MMGKKTQRSAFVGTVCLPDKMVKAKECCSPTGSKTTFFRQIKAEMTKKRGQGRLTKIDNGIVVIYIQ